MTTITVWSAGPGRPGLTEPMGVHPDHRGRGHGRAVTVAAAAALRELARRPLSWRPTATTWQPCALRLGRAHYASAGFEPQPETYDRSRS